MPRIEAIDFCVTITYPDKRHKTQRTKLTKELHLKTNEEISAYHDKLAKESPFPNNRLIIVERPTITDNTPIEFNSLQDLSYTRAEYGPFGLYKNNKYIGLVQCYVHVDYEAWMKEDDDDDEKGIPDQYVTPFIVLNNQQIPLKELTKHVVS